MFEKRNIVQINGVYTSVLFKDWYAAEYVVNSAGINFRIRVPYKKREDAEKMLAYLRGARAAAPVPDWRPMIHIIENGRVK